MNIDIAQYVDKNNDAAISKLFSYLINDLNYFGFVRPVPTNA